MAEKSVKIGSIPAEALKKGGLNETVGAEERKGSVPEKLDDGPKFGSKGERLPAAYKTAKGNIRVDH